MSMWKTESKNGVVVATYSNPPMNYFRADGTRELAGLIERWKSPDVRVVILTGGMTGKFITHYSVEELAAYASDREALRSIGISLTAGYHKLLDDLRALPKPLIAAMNGDTMGGGFELSLSCDIRIGATGDHRFGFPEVKLGIIPGGSGTQKLPRLGGRRCSEPRDEPLSTAPSEVGAASVAATQALVEESSGRRQERSFTRNAPTSPA
ncbi:MAG: enoyl-CoA hydratase/isomerase family protein [Candidatus Binatia bacterium]